MITKETMSAIVDNFPNTAADEGELVRGFALGLRASVGDERAAEMLAAFVDHLSWELAKLRKHSSGTIQ